MATLRKQEHKTLLTLKKLRGKASTEQIVKESGLSHAAVMRAALALKEKKLLKIRQEKQTLIKLNKEGKLYAEKQLPERRIVDLLQAEGGETSITEISRKLGLSQEAVPL
ncbi:MAG TPA: hypothetical protein ENG19_04030, partial [Candidatus Bathyarchaeota archaeon]|nr:hypothetical protein [Candidatus Bathyarchaeota archaeon]